MPDAPAILFFSSPDFAEPPRWDQARCWEGRPGGCKAFASILEIPPDVNGTVLTASASDSILQGDSLPGGVYHLAVGLSVLQPKAARW